MLYIVFFLSKFIKIKDENYLIKLEKEKYHEKLIKLY